MSNTPAPDVPDWDASARGDGTDVSATGSRRHRPPGVVLLHGRHAGGPESHEPWPPPWLSDGFTVYVPDRRGRGMSGPRSPDDHGITKEIDDPPRAATRDRFDNATVFWAQAPAA